MGLSRVISDLAVIQTLFYPFYEDFEIQSRFISNQAKCSYQWVTRLKIGNRFHVWLTSAHARRAKGILYTSKCMYRYIQILNWMTVTSTFRQIVNEHSHQKC